VEIFEKISESPTEAMAEVMEDARFDALPIMRALHPGARCTITCDGRLLALCPEDLKHDAADLTGGAVITIVADIDVGPFGRSVVDGPRPGPEVILPKDGA
jgi:hypothetical protein